MKHRFEHPPAPQGPKRHWRSLDDLADSPEVKQWLEREFPDGAAELEIDGVSRRKFLGILGASIALAGFTGCRRPESYLVPFNQTPEWAVPGKFLRYATALPAPGRHVPAVARVFDGRPILIEGNPAHPMSRGKCDLRTQAEVLSLYDPDRSRVAKLKGKAITAAQRDAELDAIRQKIVLSGGRGVAVISHSSTSPTYLRLRDEFLTKYNQALWCDFDPLHTNDTREVFAQLTGLKNATPFYDFSKGNADVIFSLGADFLGVDATLHAEASFADGRRIHRPADKMNRLYVAECNYTLTGQMADHRQKIAESLMPHFAAALAAACLKAGLAGEAMSALSRFANSTAPEGIEQKWIDEAAKDLVAHRGSAVVVPGERQPQIVHAIAHALNIALGAVGKSLKLAAIPRPQKGAPLEKVTNAIDSGDVDTLIVIGGNPAYNTPGDLKLTELLSKVPTVIRHGYYEDESSSGANLHVPACHPLESWGDGIAEDGSHLSVQPMIMPIFESLTDTEFLGRLLVDSPNGQNGEATQPAAYPNSLQLTQATFRELFEPTADEYSFDTAWKVHLRDGFRAGSATLTDAFSINIGSLTQITASAELSTTALPTQSMEIHFAPDFKMLDGRHVNNGWLQELPDPLTKVTWENAALISPRTARELGVTTRAIKGIVTGDVIKITLPTGALEAPVYVLPGHADNSITLPLGYGRSVVGLVGAGSGFNAYALQNSDSPWLATGAKIERTGKKHGFGCTQEHFNMEGRALQRELPLKNFKHDPAIVKKMGIDSHVPPTVNFAQGPKLDAPHQWAMSIDMTTCTGCNACVIACQAENNIPIVGKEQVQRGREMAWIRVDRYFIADDPHKNYVQDKGEFPENPTVIMQPLTCMHCENAPCETVCPVNATVHSEDGLNVMAYNRCIGTRYCANNCPYKVRRFNYFDYNKRNVLKRHKGPFGDFGNLYAGPFGEKNDPLIELQKNPNVTVRMRGVMEKCTFCVQRIEEAKIDMLIKARNSKPELIPDGYIKTACEQACPADAIVFGSIADPESRISKLKKLGHDYTMLQYLNIRPRISYLARVRNPNPAMPGAELIGISCLIDMHDHGHGAYGKGSTHSHSHQEHGEVAPHAKEHHQPAHTH